MRHSRIKKTSHLSVQHNHSIKRSMCTYQQSSSNVMFLAGRWLSLIFLSHPKLQAGNLYILLMDFKVLQLYDLEYEVKVKTKVSILPLISLPLNIGLCTEGVWVTFLLPALTKCLIKATLTWKGLFWLTGRRSSPSWRERWAIRSMRQLFTSVYSQETERDRLWSTAHFHGELSILG